MISLNGINLVPSPTVSASPEFFYFGDTVIGGNLILEVNGTHHAENETDYTSTKNAIVGLIDSCISISSSAECGGSLSFGGGVGLVRNVSVSDGGSPLDFSYGVTIECSQDNNKNTFIQNASSLPFAEFLSDSVIVSSYSETVTSSDGGSLSFSFSGSSFTKTAGKFSVQIDIGLYNNNKCNSSSAGDLESRIDNFLTGRVAHIVNNPGTLGINTGTDILCGANAKKTIRKTGGSVSFDLYRLRSSASASALAIVDVAGSNSQDQITGFTTYKLGGSITGLDSSKAFLDPKGDGMSNAWAAYNSISKSSSSGPDLLIALECGELGPKIPDLSGTCYVLSNSRITELPTSNKIDFELSYQDVEACELMGYKITAQYEERPSVRTRVEHLVPNRGALPPLVYYSNSVSAPKYKLTVQGDLTNTCLQHKVNGYSPEGHPTTEVVKGAVSTEFATKKAAFGLSSGNLIRVSRAENEGRYSYSITEEYIKCQ